VLTGAAIFVAVEGSHEEKLLDDLHDKRYQLVQELRRLTRDEVLAENDKDWEGRAVAELKKFEVDLYESFKVDGKPNKEPVWSFWNAVFFCGTIYTTIGELQTVRATAGNSAAKAVAFTLLPTE
jgi:hypothetical protein